MKCPKCESPMEPVKMGEIEVDRCTFCNGLWFDAMEKELLKDAPLSENLDVGDPNIGKELDSIRLINCPRCHIQMARMVDPHQSHIWYETCSKCHGFYMDAGEFTDYKHDTILDALRGFWGRDND